MTKTYAAKELSELVIQLFASPVTITEKSEAAKIMVRLAKQIRPNFKI